MKESRSPVKPGRTREGQAGEDKRQTRNDVRGKPGRRFLDLINLIIVPFLSLHSGGKWNRALQENDLHLIPCSPLLSRQGLEKIKKRMTVTDKDWQQLLYFRSRSEFVTTQTLEGAMQAAAIIGFRRNPVKG